MEDDIRKCKNLTIERILSGLKVTLQPSRTYMQSFNIFSSPTYNCQVSSAAGIGYILYHLNKYEIRDLFINIRKYGTKRILMLDVQEKFVKHIVSTLAPSVIIGKMNYKSTNGSNMTILMIKLSSIRQLQLPKTK